MNLRSSEKKSFSSFFCELDTDSKVINPLFNTMSLRNDNARSVYDLRYETMLDCSTNKADKQTDYTSVVLSVAL